MCWWRFTIARSWGSALKLGAELIGINNRDLRDFSVDVERTERLMGEIPAGVTVVSESGIAEAEQLSRLEDRPVWMRCSSVRR